MSNVEVDYAEIGELAKKRAKSWLERSKKYPVDRAGQLLSEVLRDPKGLDFTVGFVDNVIRPEDEKIAAQQIRVLADQDPQFLPAYLKGPLAVGGKLAPLVPEVAVPTARKVFEALVGDLVLDAKGTGLTKSIARLKARGARLNMNLLGEAVLGDKEAEKRLRDTMGLLEREDVDYVSMKVSAVIGPHNPWAYQQAVDYAVEALMPLYRKANSYSPKKFINLDMEEYHDLHLTIDVFKKILDREEFKDLKAGIVLQAYLPDSLPAMQDLQAWAAQRVQNGGSPIKVRVVKGANLSMERVEATVHGWDMVTQPNKETTDANYIRVLDWALRPEHTKNVTIGVAGMNLFTVGFAYELAKKRGILHTDGIEFEMLAGMATQQAAAVTEDVGHLLFYVPIVNPEEYDVAIAYLVRRLEENSLLSNFMSSIFELDQNEALLQREQDRFSAALSHAFDDPVGPARKQNRLEEGEAEIKAIVTDEAGNWQFQNTPDSDPSLPANLQWARQIADSMKDSEKGCLVIEEAAVTSEDQLQKIVEEAARGGKEWAARPLQERVDILHQVGVLLSKRRGELIEVAGSEAGKTIDQGDVEVSEAADFAHYYAEQANTLHSLPGAKFTPAKVIAVTPPWNFPMAIPTGGVLAALASGAGVVFKPAREARRTGAMLAQAMWDAGVPRDVLKLVDLSEGELGRALIENPLVERVILTGSIDTARLFKSWRPGLQVLAETSGKDSIIVTPHADLDLAVRDVVNSAFGHAGQKCSACSTVILVGSVGRSRRFHDQLVDAVESLKVGYPWQLDTQMGPLVSPASGKLLRGLTTLGQGEHWAVTPRQLDESGKLWSPGVRANVQPGSEYHLTEYFGPILGVMRADTLEQAVKLQNATEFGLTAGIHSLDADEINYWLDHVRAGNVYVNRGITGAIVRRQPFGGWKRSAVGAGTKAGGPSYLFGLGNWERTDVDASQITGRSLSNPALADAYQSATTLDQGGQYVQALAVSAQEWGEKEFGVGHDPSALGVERNVLRYEAVPVLVRLAQGEKPWQLLGVVAAGLAAGSQVSVSAAELPAQVREFLRRQHVPFVLESKEAFLEGVPGWAKEAGYDARLRMLGGDPTQVAATLPKELVADVAIWSQPVTVSGRVELLPFVHEQAVSFTNHRFGNPTPLGDRVEI